MKWHVENVDYALPPVPKLDDSKDWDPREKKPVPVIECVYCAIAMVEYAAQAAGTGNHPT